MRTEVLLPKWGMTMQEGTISSWLKAPGDRVVEGDVLATVETEKVTAEIQAPATGVLSEILVPAQQTVATGTLIAYIDTL